MTKARTSDVTTSARSATFARARFSRMARTAARSRSTRMARSAPRDSASIAIAPVPAYRSSTRAPGTCWARLEKTPSRAASETGRTPFGTGASRTPLAEPATILTGSRVEEPVDRALEARSELPEQPGFPGQVRVILDRGERPRPRAFDEVEVLGQACEPQDWHPRLPDVEQRPLAPQLQVLVRQLEAVGGPDQGLQPCARLQVVRLRGVEQQACRGVGTAADAAAQLVQLREAEALGVLDQHHGGV